MRTVHNLNLTRLSEARNLFSARLQRDKFLESVNDLDRAFDQWIFDATRKGSAETVSSLGRLQLSCRQYFEKMQSAMFVWRSNLSTDLNEASEKVEQCIHRLQVIDEMRSRISSLLAHSSGYPREIESLMQEATHLLELLFGSIDEGTDDEAWVKRQAQSQLLRETVTTAIGNVTRATKSLAR